MTVMSNEYMRVYMKRRYGERRAAAMKRLGGKCARCGSPEQLQFDHVDPASKTAHMDRLWWNASQARIEEELKKCQLLCKSCHDAKSATELSVQHGGGLTGKRHCRCALCRPLKLRYEAKMRM